MHPSTRTYYCPDCDGESLTVATGCPTCDGRGYTADGDRPYTPSKRRWIGRRDRNITDWLEQLARLRPQAAQWKRQGANIAFTDYGNARNRALRRTLGMAQYRFVEAAIRLDVAVRAMRDEWRAAA